MPSSRWSGLVWLHAYLTNSCGKPRNKILNTTRGNCGGTQILWGASYLGSFEHPAQHTLLKYPSCHTILFSRQQKINFWVSLSIFSQDIWHFGLLWIQVMCQLWEFGPNLFYSTSQYRHSTHQLARRWAVLSEKSRWPYRYHPPCFQKFKIHVYLFKFQGTWRIQIYEHLPLSSKRKQRGTSKHLSILDHLYSESQKQISWAIKSSPLYPAQYSWSSPREKFPNWDKQNDGCKALRLLVSDLCAKSATELGFQVTVHSAAAKAHSGQILLTPESMGPESQPARPRATKNTKGSFD